MDSSFRKEHPKSELILCMDVVTAIAEYIQEICVQHELTKMETDLHVMSAMNFLHCQQMEQEMREDALNMFKSMLGDKPSGSNRTH